MGRMGALKFGTVGSVCNTSCCCRPVVGCVMFRLFVVIVVLPESNFFPIAIILLRS